MAIRFKKTGPLYPTFIAHWRRARNLTQDQLADRIGISKATLSRIENGKIPYSQDFLEECAVKLSCEPADLIMRNPEAPNAPWAILDSIPPSDRPRVIEILKAFARTGT